MLSQMPIFAQVKYSTMKKLPILFAIVFAFTIHLKAQNDTTKVVYAVVDTKPEFPGGEKAMFKFIEENLAYPDKAEENKIQGMVFIQFVIDTNGKTIDIEVAKGHRPCFRRGGRKNSKLYA
jgi:hypothetical protein